MDFPKPISPYFKSMIMEFSFVFTLYNFSLAYHTSSSSAAAPGRKESSRFKSSRERDKIFRRETMATGRCDVAEVSSK